mmetsp:Transcript_11026/g.34040  ORF Transcript_11026/g.34040 Transcript_11026/m.34040 type:complete len:236 (+) Transcript_11026:307-1014(+)
MAAPKAAASSGRDERRTDRPRAFETTSTTASMRAAPPTNKTWSMSDMLRSASVMASGRPSRIASSTGSMICEYFERESDRSRCLGPEASAVMNGSDTGAVSEEHNSALAASAASCSRTNARWSVAKSIPCWFRNPSTMCCTSAVSSASDPTPRCRFAATTSHSVSLFTSACPSLTLRRSVSEEDRPPTSSTATVEAACISEGNSDAAHSAAATAEGSSSSRWSPARVPAIRIAWR